MLKCEYRTHHWQSVEMKSFLLCVSIDNVLYFIFYQNDWIAISTDGPGLPKPVRRPSTNIFLQFEKPWSSHLNKFLQSVVHNLCLFFHVEAPKHKHINNRAWHTNFPAKQFFFYFKLNKEKVVTKGKKNN